MKTWIKRSLIGLTAATVVLVASPPAALAATMPAGGAKTA